MPFRKIVQKAVDQANRRLAERMPRYALQEVAGVIWLTLSFTRLQYELHLNGRRIGETLVIGLTRTNRVTAFLLPNQREVAEGWLTIWAWIGVQFLWQCSTTRPQPNS